MHTVAWAFQMSCETIPRATDILRRPYAWAMRHPSDSKLISYDQNGEDEDYGQLWMTYVLQHWEDKIRRNRCKYVRMNNTSARLTGAKFRNPYHIYFPPANLRMLAINWGLLRREIERRTYRIRPSVRVPPAVQ